MDETTGVGLQGCGCQIGSSERLRPAPRAAAEAEPDLQRPVIFGKRVLIADGWETNLALMTELLDQDRHQIAVARSGMQALEILCLRDFDVLFRAEYMEDMTGAKLLQLYRFGKPEAPPGYLMSVADTAWIPESVRASGATGLMRKPIASKEALRAAIARVCVLDPLPPKTRWRHQI